MGALAAAFSLALFCRLPALASVDHTASLAAVKAQAAPPLDASLAASVWQTALKADGFVNFTTRAAAGHATTAYLLYDDKNLYVGFICAQAGAPITATQTVDNAGVSNDDNVTIEFSTSDNGTRVYTFSVNPHGVRAESSSENSRFAPPWQAVSTILPTGDWRAMMVIPLSDLHAQGGSAQTWRINFVRFVAASSDQYTWAYEPTQTDPGNTQNWPALTGITVATAAARPLPRADIYGLSTAGSDRRQFQNNFGSFQDTNPRALGIDATYPLSSTLSFVGTLNPDFSNIEQDQTIIAPQEFRRNFNEYRPFFSQGSNFINSLAGINVNSFQQMFYSPSIGIFNRGEKLEGTIGKGGVGALNVAGAGFDDTAFGYNYSRPDNSLGAAFQGVMANHTGVLDDTYGSSVSSINPHSGYAAIANFEQENGTNVGAVRDAQSLELATGVLTARGTTLVVYQDNGPEFNPIDGFTQINDARGPVFAEQYNGAGGNGAIKSYNVIFLADRFVDRSGAAREADAIGGLTATFKNLVSLGVRDSTSELRSYAQAFPIYTGAQVTPFNLAQIAFGYRDGTPSPIDASYGWGSFGGAFTQQMTSSTSHQFGPVGLSLEYDGTVEHALAGLVGGPTNSQWLRRVSLTRSFGKDTTLAFGVRSINGTGGFALPGNNLAFSFYRRFANQDLLYVDYGTPAANQTLHRWVMKFVFHVGGASGT